MSIDGLKAKLSFESYCSSFQQTKYLKALSKPLKSAGSVSFQSGLGVLWKVDTPFPAKVLIREMEIIQWPEKGEPVRINRSRSPVLRGFTDVFLTLFSGDFDALLLAFTPVLSDEGNGWQLVLSPRSEALRSVIHAITIDGHDFIEEVRISELSGDETLILFSNVSTISCKIEIDESHLLTQ